MKLRRSPESRRPDATYQLERVVELLDRQDRRAHVMQRFLLQMAPMFAQRFPPAHRVLLFECLDELKKIDREVF